MLKKKENWYNIISLVTKHAVRKIIPQKLRKCYRIIYKITDPSNSFSIIAEIFVHFLGAPARQAQLFIL